LANQTWKDKLSNTAQLGGIETAVLDNGLGRGTRIAWINTGTGLRYKVVIDRAMDIADAFFNQHSLGWISHAGVTYPQPFSNRGLDWLKTFGGGLLTTCGLDHVGGPESDEYGERGLHGPISNIRAEMESILQPDPLAGKMEMSLTGTMKQARMAGPSLELKRVISGTLGKPGISITDTVLNRGSEAAPHMLLYHFNFGWPLVDEGSAIHWRGKWHPREAAGKSKIFIEGNDFHTCPQPLDDHRGGGEEVAYINPDTDAAGICACGIHNERLGIAMVLRFRKNQLPWLSNWQHWAKGEYVTGLEPGTNPPIGQTEARRQQQLIFIQPGESKTYQLELEVLTDKLEISEVFKHISNR